MFSVTVSELIVEFIGTFLVTLPVPLASAFVGPLVALAFGFMTASMIYSFLFISGAHFNPAVSFAMFISQRMSLKRFLLFTIVQTFAAFFAGLYAAFPIGVDVAAPETADIAKAWKATTIEIAFTFAFVTSYMHTCVSRQRANQYYGFAMGFSLIAAVLCVPEGFNGSAFNPAIATALQLTKCFQQTDYCIHLVAIWVHWVAPFLGAFLAVLLYGILDTEDKPGQVVQGPYTSPEEHEKNNTASKVQFDMGGADHSGGAAGAGSPQQGAADFY